MVYRGINYATNVARPRGTAAGRNLTSKGHEFARRSPVKRQSSELFRNRVEYNISRAYRTEKEREWQKCAQRSMRLLINGRILISRRY